MTEPQDDATQSALRKMVTDQARLSGFMRGYDQGRKDTRRLIWVRQMPLVFLLGATGGALAHYVLTWILGG